MKISTDLRWERNGVISLAATPGERMIMFESGFIDELFRGIGELIGLSVDNIVIESRCRETRRFTERLYPLAVRKILEGQGGRPEGQGLDISEQERETLLDSMRVITSSLVDRGKVYGYGDQQLGELWEQGGDYPWRKLYLSDPYSLLFQAADNTGWIEAFEGADMWVRYTRTDGERYVTEVYPSEHPVGLRKRQEQEAYRRKNGDIQHKRCVECGMPLEVARHRWDQDRGTITDPDTGRRVAIFNPASMDGIFDDLRSELGEAIQSTVVEATRRFVRQEWEGQDWNREGLSYRQMFALRGLGNPIFHEGNRDEFTITVENICLPLCVTGLVQALVEMANGMDASEVTWWFVEDGTLSVIVQRK